MYLSRHAKASHNRDSQMEAELVGVKDTPLSVEGIEQSLHLRSIIRFEGLEFDEVRSSRLRRSSDTVEIGLGIKDPVAEGEGYRFEEGFPVLVDADNPMYDGVVFWDERLLERRYGDKLTGTKKSEIMRKFGTKYEGKNPLLRVDVVPDGGQSLREVYDQSWGLRRELDRGSVGKKLLSTHGARFGMLDLALRGVELDEVTDDDGNVDHGILIPDYAKLFVYERRGHNYECVDRIG